MHGIIIGIVMGIIVVPFSEAGVGDVTLHPDPKVTSTFFRGDRLELIMSLMQTHFSHSLGYLYMSKQYGSQYVQRPGMAKLLAEASDKQWEDGIDLLKKYLQRGGILNEKVTEKFDFGVQGDANLLTSISRDTSDTTLVKVRDNTADLLVQMNTIHNKAIKNSEHGDGEFANYFNEKMESMAKRLRELNGNIVTLNGMETIGMAADLFDSNL